MKIIILILSIIFHLTPAQFLSRSAPYPPSGLRPSKQFSLPVKGKLEIYGPPPVKQISQQYGPPPLAPGSAETFLKFNEPQAVYGKPKNGLEPFNFQNPPSLNPNNFRQNNGFDNSFNTFPLNQNPPIFDTNVQFRKPNFEITTALPEFTTRNFDNNQFDVPNFHNVPNIQTRLYIERANVRELPKNANLKKVPEEKSSKIQISSDFYSESNTTTVKPVRRRPVSTTTESAINPIDSSNADQPNVAVANSFAGRLYLQQPNGNLVLINKKDAKLPKEVLPESLNPNNFENQNYLERLRLPTLKSEDQILPNPFYSFNVPVYQLK